MLLAGLSCLLCDGSLYCPSVSEGAGLESLCISRKILDSGISDVVCKFLELGILGNEVGLASEAYQNSLVTVYTCDYGTFCSLAVSPLGCYELAFLADDLLCPLIVAVGFMISIVLMNF